MESIFLSCMWFISFWIILTGLKLLKPILAILQESWGLAHKMKLFQAASQKVYQLQEMLSAGLVPEQGEWKSLTELPKPWNEITYKSVMELRDQGAPVLPTLRRIRTSLEEQVELMQESQAKSSQAWSQAIIGMVIVPVFSAVLYTILPGIEEHSGEFFGVTFFSFSLTAFALIWISIMIDQARFGGVKKELQSWYGNSLAATERLWAFVNTGLPPDLAWKKMIEELSKNDPLLAQTWGGTIWSSEPISNSAILKSNEFERLIGRLGLEIKKSIQQSLNEGRGSLERMEGIHRAFMTEYRLKLIRELNLLPNRCLKPLFLFVFPAIFILLIAAVGIVASSAGSFI